MKIAFTSCMSPNSYSSQPVWTCIGEQQPDVLVLLGDSVYIDCPPHPDDSEHQHPKDPGYKDNTFAEHLHSLYEKQLAVPEFKTLISRADLQTYAIWDDHDFLWNDADHKDAYSTLHMNQAVLSANLFQCWRAALQGASFPASIQVHEVQKNYQTPVQLGLYDSLMPGYTHVALTEHIHLHLSDGRSWRTKTELLGQAQRQAMTQIIMNETPPNALHLIASGSTFSRHGREGWSDRPIDKQWLLEIASQRRILMLSGDIHRNAAPAPVPTDTGLCFYEATASGAAVNFNPLHWRDHDPGHSWLNYSQKFGLLNIHDQQVDVTLFDHGQGTPAPYSPIPMASWRVLP